jgi:hypothetical protein
MWVIINLLGGLQGKTCEPPDDGAERRCTPGLHYRPMA